jgi:predicted transcriptional regulator
MVRRTNKELRIRILCSFSNQPRPIREIAHKSKVDWYATERHLNYLKGRELVTEVFRHKLLRLFQLTNLGKDVVSGLKNKKNAEIQKIIKRL